MESSPDSNNVIVQRRPSPVLLASLAAIAAITIGGIGFLVGKGSSSDEPVAAATAVSPAPETTEAETTPRPETQDAATRFAADFTVLADVNWGTERALVGCSPAGGKLEFLQLTKHNSTEWYVGQRHSLLNHTRYDSCKSCSAKETTTIDSRGSIAVYGSCLTGGSNGAATAYVITEPTQPGASAASLAVTCGGSHFEVDDDGLILRSHAWKSGSAEPNFWFPNIRFEMTPQGVLYPDDEVLLRHYCTLSIANGVSLEWDFFDPTTRLPYDPIQTAVGEMGVYGPVILGLDQASCDLLYRTWRENLDADVPATQPISDLLDLLPPVGLDDWHVDCQKPTET